MPTKIFKFTDEEIKQIGIKTNQWAKQIKDSRQVSINIADVFVIETSLDVYFYKDGVDLTSSGNEVIKVNKNVSKEYVKQLNSIKQELYQNYNFFDNLIHSSKEVKSFKSFCNRILKSIISYCNKNDFDLKYVLDYLKDNLR